MSLASGSQACGKQDSIHTWGLQCLISLWVGTWGRGVKPTQPCLPVSTRSLSSPPGGAVPADSPTARGAGAGKSPQLRLLSLVPSPVLSLAAPPPPNPVFGGTAWHRRAQHLLAPPALPKFPRHDLTNPDVHVKKVARGRKCQRCRKRDKQGQGTQSVVCGACCKVRGQSKRRRSQRKWSPKSVMGFVSPRRNGTLSKPLAFYDGEGVRSSS